ncbi:MAG: trypsin-like peptidase domain-containing protein [bacterium]|nr:trypsin-like peptidase domain-containing protein [bacterium]
MNNFSPRQLIAAVIVVSVATSFLTVLVSFGFLTGERPAEVVERIIEQAPGGSAVRDIAKRGTDGDEPIVAVVKRAAPSVVSIVATKDVPIVERYFINPFEGDPRFGQFFGREFGVPQFRQRGTEERQVGAGSGFIVSADGLILTNKHVVADAAADYTVFLNDGTKLPAKVLARDPVQDLAIMKVERSGLPPVTLGDSDRVEVGQTVVAIGNTLGEFRNTVSVGVISGLERTVIASGPQGGPEELAELIQTDAAINPGNSGGPLLNLRGEVIGINTAMAQGAENVGFAYLINKAKRDIESVKTSGRIIYPFLGIRYVMVTPGIAAEKKLPVDFGAYLVGGEGNPAIVAGGPAEKAGLKEGDIIVEFNGERVDIPHTLAGLVGKYQAGEQVTLKARRGADTLTLTATLEERK